MTEKNGGTGVGEGTSPRPDSSHAASDGADDRTAALLTGLGETTRKVRDDVLPRIQEHVSGHDASSELDLFRVKNDAMITYLIELVSHVRHEASAMTTAKANVDDEEDDNESSHDPEAESTTNKSRPNAVPRRLMEVKAVIDKTRNLEQKLRYQIDKLLAAASTEEESSDLTKDSEDEEDGIDGAKKQRNRGAHRTDDPLEHRPNVGALMGDDDDDDGDDDEEASSSSSDNDGNRGDSDVSDEVEDDEEIAAARRTLALAGKGTATKKKRQGGDDDDQDRQRTIGSDKDVSHELYRAPRMASVPYTADAVDRRAERAKRERQKLRAGEVATALRSRYSDAPDVEDVHGGAELGRQRDASRRLAQKQHERTQYEESNMVRLTETRKDKKLRKRLMRQEMSNLSAIADLGSIVVRGLGHNKGGGDSDGDGNFDGRGSRRGKVGHGRTGAWNDDGGGGGDGQRYSNGKRRRSGEGGGAGAKKAGFQSSNALQAALYGGGHVSGSGSGKKKKKGASR